MKRLVIHGLIFMLLLCSFAAAPLSAHDDGSPPAENSAIGTQGSDGRGDPVRDNPEPSNGAAPSKKTTPTGARVKPVHIVYPVVR